MTTRWISTGGSLICTGGSIAEHTGPSLRSGRTSPSPTAGLRPLGIAALEDKIVQQAVRTVLECIYEQDFLGFSYGFRPGRGAHRALDALYRGDRDTEGELDYWMQISEASLTTSATNG